MIIYPKPLLQKRNLHMQAEMQWIRITEFDLDLNKSTGRHRTGSSEKHMAKIYSLMLGSWEVGLGAGCAQRQTQAGLGQAGWGT
jgi:hypothetical protein